MSKALISLRDFSMGINAKDGPSLIDDRELVDAENAILGKGYVMKRNGYELFAAAPITNTLTWTQFGVKKWSEV